MVKSRVFSAIEATLVEVSITELAEDMPDATVVVKDSKGVVREVVAKDLVKGDKVAQFAFVTPIDAADLVGVWTVNDIEYSFVELGLVEDIVAESGKATPNQVKLFDLLKELGIENLNSDLIGDYATAIDAEAPTTKEEVQAVIDQVNSDSADSLAEADVVKAVADATNQIDLLAALKDNFERVNADWIAEYASENVTLADLSTETMLALADANYFGKATGASIEGIQDAIDAVNDNEITTADGNANTAAKQMAVTALIQNWVAEDEEPATDKADLLAASKAKEAAYRVAEAGTANSLYNALVAYANATVDANLKVSELNPNIKSDYFALLNDAAKTAIVTAVNADALATIVGNSGQLAAGVDAAIKTALVTTGETAALNDALSDIDGLTSTNAAAEVKTALQRLADVTSHKTSADKFDMTTVKDSELLNYVTTTNGFETVIIDTIAKVNTAIEEVNGGVNEDARLEAVNAATDATQMQKALTAVAVAESVNDYINLPAQGKLEVAELVLAGRNASDPAEFADTAAVTGAIGNSTSGAIKDRADFISSVNTAAGTGISDVITALNKPIFPEFEALDPVDQVEPAEAVKTEYERLQALDTPEEYQTIKQIKDAAGL